MSCVQGYDAVTLSDVGITFSSKQRKVNFSKQRKVNFNILLNFRNVSITVKTLTSISRNKWKSLAVDWRIGVVFREPFICLPFSRPIRNFFRRFYNSKNR